MTIPSLRFGARSPRKIARVAQNETRYEPPAHDRRSGRAGKSPGRKMGPAHGGPATAPPRPLSRFSRSRPHRVSAAPLGLALMPIHEKLRGSDYPTIRNYLRVTMCNIYDVLTKHGSARDRGPAGAAVAGAENHAFKVWARQFADQRKISFIVGTVQSGAAVFSAIFPVLSSIAILKK